MFKKIICLILIACLFPVLFVVFVFANETQTDYGIDEMQILKENGIIKGDPNGDLRPDDALTRAEFAVILCRVIGAEELAKTAGMIEKEYFRDVPKTHWAAGYINTAAEYKAINGYENRTFRPELAVTNEQVVKMLVAAWGYGEEAEKLGGYPDGYMEIARRYGVTDAVLFNYGIASKRWVACAFTYGALNMPVYKDAEIAPPFKTDPIEYDYNNPKPENRDYIDDAVSILKKVTPVSAKYERKVFEQLVPAYFMPFMFNGAVLVFDENENINGRKINIYISRQGVKEPFVDEYFTQNSFDLSRLPVGNWQCQLSIIDGAVKDSYFAPIKKLENNIIEFTGDVFRYTTLNAQPAITEETDDLNITGKQSGDLYPFALILLKDKKDNNSNFALSVSYLPVLPNNNRFMLSMNSMDLYYPPVRSENGSDMSGIYSNPIQGKNEIAGPVVFYDLQLNTDYYIQMSVTNIHGEGISLNGNIRLIEVDKNGNIDYLFEGSVRTISVKSYEIISYEFDTVELQPDSGPGVGVSTPVKDTEMIFEPVSITTSWIAGFAGSGAIKINAGILNFGSGTVIERYIDIKGANGEIRLLQNTVSDHEGYTKTLFWSAKQQAGASVVKNFNGEIKCAVLFEFPDGSCYLYGYIEGDGTDYWQLGIPGSNYYKRIK